MLVAAVAEANHCRCIAAGEWGFVSVVGHGRDLDVVVQHADVQSGGALVPVLAARDEAVDARVDELFPTLVSKSVRISNSTGWGAGRAAADLADLGVRDRIAR